MSCPACGQDFTAKPDAIWEVLLRRQRAHQQGSEEQLARIEHRLNKQTIDGCHDLQYEAGVDAQLPRAEPIEHLVAALDDLRSQWNVGSIFRTADCAGWGGVHLCGITPLPTTRRVRRVSLGAETYVRWDYHARVLEAIQRRVAEGFIPVALEQTDDAQDLQAFDPPQRILLIVGNEVSGVSREALRACPIRVHIPLAGRKASLNVAVAFGVAAVELRRRWLRRYGGGD